MSSSGSAASERYVFVYGTLRRGQRNDINRFVPAPSYVGDALIAGLLYDLGDYPGLRLGGTQRVKGEVYAISSALESQLDVLEEVAPVSTGEYARREIAVEVQGRVLNCLVYELAGERVAERQCLASGDWVRRG